MDKDRKRSIRRHHEERMYKRAVIMYKGMSCFGYEWVENAARRTHNYMAVCSCSMCGNPRRHNWGSKDLRLTVQERKAIDSEKSQIAEWEEG